MKGWVPFASLAGGSVLLVALAIALIPDASSPFGGLFSAERQRSEPVPGSDDESEPTRVATPSAPRLPTSEPEFVSASRREHPEFPPPPRPPIPIVQLPEAPPSRPEPWRSVEERRRMVDEEDDPPPRVLTPELEHELADDPDAGGPLDRPEPKYNRDGGLYNGLTDDEEPLPPRVLTPEQRRQLTDD